MPAPDPDGVYISERREGRITVTHEGYLWSNSSHNRFKRAVTFLGGYSAAHGAVLGAGRICKHGAELMPGIAVKDAASMQHVRGGCGEANFPNDFGKILR
tara:strand:- start:11278 stop:11577 length:300 start_codon:yes stop_codon:yes gene_type:complete